MLDSSADCIKVLDLDARIESMNEGGRRVMEIDDFAGIAGMDWTGFWDQEIRPRPGGRGRSRVGWRRALHRAGLHDEGHPEVVGRAVDADPRRRRCGRQAPGRIPDVSANRKAEEALLASEIRYRDLYDSIDAGFCVIEVKLDATERPAGLSLPGGEPAFERQSGLKGVLGSGCAALPTATRSTGFEIYDRIARGGAPERFEHVANALVDRWFEVYAYPFGGSGSHQVAVLFNDITARKRTEDALRASEASQRSILATVPVGILFAEAPSGRVVGGNAFMERVTAGRPSSLTAWKATASGSARHVDGRRVAPTEFPVARVIREGLERAELEAEFERPDGSRIWTLFVATPVRTRPATSPGWSRPSPTSTHAGGPRSSATCSTTNSAIA